MNQKYQDNKHPDDVQRGKQELYCRLFNYVVRDVFSKTLPNDTLLDSSLVRQATQ